MRKLYLFTNTKGDGFSGWEHCYAMSDTGHVLASHICSSIVYMEHDLITSRPERKEMYEAHFGGERDVAFKVVVLKAGDLPPKEVLGLNTKLSLEAKPKDENKASVEIEFSNS